MSVNHPQFGTMCAICFHGLTPENCAEDADGQKWDLCKGECARHAGVQEQVINGVVEAERRKPAEDPS